ncbi:MAG: hypothetical protein ACK5MS_16820, partial [Planctomyces sp.]
TGVRGCVIFLSHAKPQRGGGARQRRGGHEQHNARVGRRRFAAAKRTRGDLMLSGLPAELLERSGSVTAASLRGQN